MTKALLVIDVQNDFCEGGSLAVDGGMAVAAGISRYLAQHPDAHDVVLASRDWHDPGNVNGGHFAEGDAEPDFITTWPVHCVAGTPGAEYSPALDTNRIDRHVLKGQGFPAYSIFDGTVDGRPFRDVLAELGVTEVSVAGIATDYCVRASALDAVDAGLAVTVLTGLCTGVAADSTRLALDELADRGAQLVGAA